MTVDQLHRLIREAGRIPVERDTLYRRVIRRGREWSVGEPVHAQQNA
jgi:aminodeoxyfutalosine synthase